MTKPNVTPELFEKIMSLKSEDWMPIVIQIGEERERLQKENARLRDALNGIKRKARSDHTMTINGKSLVEFIDLALSADDT